MVMDPDAADMMAALKRMLPLPSGETIASEYRAGRAAEVAQRQVEIIPVTQVVDFVVMGTGGKVFVRSYRDGGDPSLRPTLIYMHGGGFVTCSIETHDAYCRTLARETGMTILSIDYRLAPEHPFPAGFEDCRDVLLWAASEAARARGVDPNKLIVGGDSAGGAFAAALCLWARDTRGPQIAHQLLVYPVINNDFTTRSYVENGRDYYLTTDAMRWFWRQYLGDENRVADPLATPGRAADLAGLPPATVVTAGYDPLRDEGADYARRLDEAGVPVAYREYPGTFHGFAGIDSLDSARRSRAFIVKRLRQAGGVS